MIDPYMNMANKRNPEERATQGPSLEGEGAAQPTGEEVRQAEPKPRAAAARADRPARKDAAAAQAAPQESEVDRLNAVASEYYGRLADTAERLNQQTRALYETYSGYMRQHPGSLFLGALALGVLIGFLAHRD